MANIFTNVIDGGKRFVEKTPNSTLGMLAFGALAGLGAFLVVKMGSINPDDMLETIADSFDDSSVTPQQAPETADDPIEVDAEVIDQTE